MSGTRTYVNEIGGAAEMAAFCIPGPGTAIAALISGGLAVYNLTYNEDSAPPLVTTEDLNAAVDEIKAAIKDAFEQHDLDEIHDQIRLNRHTLGNAWQDLSDGIDLFHMQSLTTPFSEDWKVYFADIKEPSLAPNSDLEKALVKLARRLEIKNKKVEDFQGQAALLLILAVGTFLSTAKLGLMIEIRDGLSEMSKDPKYSDYLAYLDGIAKREDAEFEKEKKAWLIKYRKKIIEAKRKRISRKEAGIPDPPVQNKMDKATRERLHAMYDSPFVLNIKHVLLGLHDEDGSTGYLEVIQDFSDFIEDCHARYKKRTAEYPDRVTINSKHEILVDGKKVADGLTDGMAPKIREEVIGKFALRARQEDLTDTNVENFTDGQRDLFKAVVADWSYAKDDALEYLKTYQQPAT